MEGRSKDKVAAVVEDEEVAVVAASAVVAVEHFADLGLGAVLLM